MQNKVILLVCLLSIALALSPPDNCKTWTRGISPINNKYVCSSCNSGYNLNLGWNECQLPYSDVWCHAFYPNGVCKQCSWRTYNNSGHCEPVSDYCKTWSQTTGQCLTCYDGYQLNAAKDCEVSSSTTPNPTFDPLCRRFNSANVCIECSYRSQFDSNGVCQEVSPYCKTWNKTTRWCESCYIGYRLNTNNGACQL